MCGSRGGGAGGPVPLQNHKYIGFPSNTGPAPLKITKLPSQNAKYLMEASIGIYEVIKTAKIRNRYNQVPHLTQDTNGKVTTYNATPQTRAKRPFCFVFLLIFFELL